MGYQAHAVREGNQPDNGGPKLRPGAQGETLKGKENVKNMATMSISSNMKDGEWNVEGWAIYTLFSGGGSEPLSDFRPSAILRTLLGAREKPPPKRPAAGLARQG